MIAASENYLRQGPLPPGRAAIGNRSIKSAVRMVADQYPHIPRKTIIFQFGTPTHPGTFFRVFGLFVDWSQYRSPSPQSAPEPIDHVEQRRAKDEATRLRAQ